MSNAYLQLAKTTTIPAIIRRACVFAQLSDNTDKWKWLGATETDALTELAAIYMDCVRGLYNELPLLNVTHTDLTTTANQPYVLLPTDRRDSDILALHWVTDATMWMDQVELVRISPADALELPAKGIYPSDTDEYPAWFCIAWEQQSGVGHIQLFPTPRLAHTLRLVYRQQETAITAMTVKQGSTTVSQIPDAMMKLIAIALAMELCDRGKNRDRYQQLIPMLSFEITNWRDKLIGDLVSLRQNVLQNGGLPRTPDMAIF